MTEPIPVATSHSSRTFLGFPLEGFGLFTSLLLTVTSGFFAFFSTTAIAIFSLLAWNLIGHHSVNYTVSYLYVGLPAGILVLVVAMVVFGTLWIRARLM